MAITQRAPSRFRKLEACGRSHLWRAAVVAAAWAAVCTPIGPAGAQEREGTGVEAEPTLDYHAELETLLSSWAGYGVTVHAQIGLDDGRILAVYGRTPFEDWLSDAEAQGRLAEVRQQIDSAQRACEARAVNPLQQLGCAGVLTGPAAGTVDTAGDPCQRLYTAEIDVSAAAPAIERKQVLVLLACRPDVRLAPRRADERADDPSWSPPDSDPDADNETEIIVEVERADLVVREDEQPTTYREWLIVDANELDVEGRVELDRHSPNETSRRAHAAFTDLNADGFPDVAVFVTLVEPPSRCAEGDEACSRHTLEWLVYEPMRDGWGEQMGLPDDEVPAVGLPCPRHPDCEAGANCRCDGDGLVEP